MSNIFYLHVLPGVHSQIKAVKLLLLAALNLLIQSVHPRRKGCDAVKHFRTTEHVCSYRAGGEWASASVNLRTPRRTNQNRWCHYSSTEAKRHRNEANMKK